MLFAAAEALIDEKDIAQSRAYGDEILKQAKSIAETVKNLSLYAQPGTRHDLRLVDIADSVADAVHLAQRTLCGNQVVFKITMDPVPEILAKSEEIQLVLFNILRNSIQALSDKGRIDIHTGLEGDLVSVSIQDDGPGIPKDHLNRVFDPFFTTKGPDEGEGLGLYIVRQIVSRYQGTIDVENAESGGAQFMIRFPIANRTQNQEEHS